MNESVSDIVEIMLTGENRRTRREKHPVTMPLCTPKISHGLTWDGTWASAVTDRQATA
jgi:hypothetical protein